MIEQMNQAVSLIERTMPDGSTVRAALVAGSRHRLVVDTLMSPADVAPFGPADLVVYTHADWDHCWGTRAFPGALVIGHERTRQRLLGRTEADLLDRMSGDHPAFFQGSAIVPPAVTFSERLTLDLGGVTAELHHAPGHTADAVVLHLPEHGMLLAGDVAEDPIPSLNEPGHLRGWAPLLRRWAASGIMQVVPSHGAVSGPELLLRNAGYLEELLGEVERLLKVGSAFAEIQARLPVERFLPDVDQYHAYYRSVHPGNVATAVAELQAG